MRVFVFVSLWIALISWSYVAGDGFVRRSGTRFVDADCKEVMYVGWNSWQLMEAAAGLTDDSVEWILDTMRDSGLTVGRFFGHGHSHATLVLQTSPGEYNFDALAALDRVLAALAERGLRAVLTLTDNWTEADSKQQYARWAEKDPDEFYTDDQIKIWFKNHILFMATRENSVTGVVYRDDPTIFAWNVMNEPRCECYRSGCSPTCRDRIQSWIDEMTDYLKSVDPYHMVTVGEEGFFSFESGRHESNPDVGKDDPWASSSGQDFIPNHAGATIDYGAVHSWVDNWGYLPIEFQDNWIYQHLDGSSEIGKPMVLEEFGKQVLSFDASETMNNRDPYYRAVFTIFNSERVDGLFKGVGFWEFGTILPYGVHTDHSTWNDIIVPESQALAQMLADKEDVGGCSAGARRSTDVIGFGDGLSYTTHGVHLITVDATSANTLEQASGTTIEDCASQCQQEESCVAFQFEASDGTCILVSDNEGSLMWNSAGFQQYDKSS